MTLLYNAKSHILEYFLHVSYCKTVRNRVKSVCLSYTFSKYREYSNIFQIAKVFKYENTFLWKKGIKIWRNRERTGLNKSKPIGTDLNSHKTNTPIRIYVWMYFKPRLGLTSPKSALEWIMYPRNHFSKVKWWWKPNLYHVYSFEIGWTMSWK